jgi:hypothetical protein
MPRQRGTLSTAGGDVNGNPAGSGRAGARSRQPGPSAPAGTAPPPPESTCLILEVVPVTVVPVIERDGVFAEEPTHGRGQGLAARAEHQVHMSGQERPGEDLHPRRPHYGVEARHDVLPFPPSSRRGAAGRSCGPSCGAWCRSKIPDEVRKRVQPEAWVDEDRFDDRGPIGGERLSQTCRGEQS